MREVREDDITVGADPEFFLAKDGKPISAHDMVPGDKHHPFPVVDGAIQADGVAVEFNITPCTTLQQFQARVDTVLEQIRFAVPDEYEFWFLPSVRFDPQYFDTVPDYVKELGCEPDYSPSGKPNPKPIPQGYNRTLRTGAGHMHFGWCNGASPFSEEHMTLCCSIAEALGKYYTKYIPRWDKDDLRSTLYGYNDCFRPKSYGIEYRRFSNAWLGRRDLWPWLFTNSRKIVAATLSGVEPQGLLEYPE
jgi:hypothetical protein